MIKFSKINKKILKINKENFSVQRRLPDIKNLLKDTGFKNKSNFEDNLKKTYDWYEKNLSTSEPSFTGNERKYLNNCITSGYVSSVGKYVNIFEEKIKILREANIVLRV